MVKNIIKISALALLATTAVANAGGFGRGTADTDILYEEGNFNLRSGVTVVIPNRSFKTIGGVAGTDGKYTETYVIPSSAIKLNLTDDARCAATYTEVYGGSTSFGNQAFRADLAIVGGVPTSNATRSVKLGVDEFGATCGYKFDLSKGRAWIIGGIFTESFGYEEATAFGTLKFDGGPRAGFRLGAAYEIPEIALRAQAIYRSEVDHKPGGTFVGGIPRALPAGSYSVVGAGTTPQSFEVKLQSGIATDTLAFVNVKWTDWSVIDTLDYVIASRIPNQNRYFWRDGWSVTAGVGRKFSDSVSGVASLGWDRGVSTGLDLLTDTWTLAAGVSIKDSIGGELRAGGAINYLTSGSQSRAKGAGYDATVGGDFALAFGAGYQVKW